LGESGEDKGIVMFIKKINIQKNGKLTEKLMFNQGLSIVKGSADLYDVINLIIGNQETGRTFHDIVFDAEVLLDKIYYIRGHKSKGERLFEYKVFYDDNVECTDEYLAMVQQNKELESSLFFHAFKKQNFPHRLMHYKDVLKYYPNGDFASLTNGYGTTRSFRGFMTQYIKYFKPIKLHKGKDLFLKLSNSGQFYVESVNCGEKVLLSDEKKSLLFTSKIYIGDELNKIIENVSELENVIVNHIDFKSAKLPDVDLYYKLSKNYEYYIDLLYSKLEKNINNQSSSILNDYTAIQKIEKFGEVLKKYPELNELCKNGDINAIVNAMNNFR
jgi:hypothetical protein